LVDIDPAVALCSPPLTVIDYNGWSTADDYLLPKTLRLKLLVDSNFKLLVDTEPVIVLVFAIAQPVTVYTTAKHWGGPSPHGSVIGTKGNQNEKRRRM
jgi:hypothetical protein